MRENLKLYQWQSDSVEKFRNCTEAFYMADMGTGKSGAAITLWRKWCENENGLLRTLIISPTVTLQNWKNEFSVFSNVRAHNILVLDSGSGKGKAKQVQETTGALIVITNYEAILNEELFVSLHDNLRPSVIICDESHYIKTHNSKRTKLVLELSKRCKYKILMSGTPLLNRCTDLFSQFLVLDGGMTLGTNYYVFQNKYMVDKNANWKGRNKYFPKWENNPEKEKELQDKVFTKSVRVMKSECLDLPPLIKLKETIPMSPEQKKAYDTFKRDLLVFIDRQREDGTPLAVIAELAITKAMKLLQIANGFAIAEDKIVQRYPCPKLDRMMEKILELYENHKIILWCSFKEHYKMISERLKEHNIKHVFLTGEQSTKEKQESIQDFCNDKSIPCIIANRGAGGVGCNLVESDYAINVSRNFKLSEELQSESRNYRGGSERHETIIKLDLVTEGSIEEDVVTALNNKEELSSRILDILKEEA